jgi:methionyl aminopeptidase
MVQYHITLYGTVEFCKERKGMIFIKTQKEIQIMREGGKILAQIMRDLKERVKPGISTKELEKRAKALILKYRVKPAFKDYQGFPALLCTSINEEVVHGVPSERKLKEGDIISLDLGISYKGFFVDMAITLPVGQVLPEVQRLIRVTKKALKRAIRKVRLGNTIGDIGNSIQRYVERQGFSVIKELCGHGIGKELHEEPQIFNEGKRHKGPKLREGMVFCIEPMVAMGRGDIEKLKDGYGFKTKDNSLSAHFEHTVAMTRKGCQILTELK